MTKIMSVPILRIASYHMTLLNCRRSGKYWVSLVAETAQNLPAMWETLGWEDSLEKGMATHSRILTWRVPWTEEPGRLQSIGSQRLDMTEGLTLSLHTGKCSLWQGSAEGSAGT